MSDSEDKGASLPDLPGLCGWRRDLEQSVNHGLTSDLINSPRSGPSVSAGTGEPGSMRLVWSAHDFANAIAETRGAAIGALWASEAHLAYAAVGTPALVLPAIAAAGLELDRVPPRLVVFDAVVLAGSASFSPRASAALWDVQIADFLFSGARQPDRSLERLVKERCENAVAVKLRASSANSMPGAAVRADAERARALLELGASLARYSWTSELDALVSIETQAAIAVADMQCAGVLLDVEGLRALVHRAAVERDGFAAILRECGIDRPTSEADVTRGLARLVGQPVASSKDGLRRLGDHEVVSVLTAFRRQSAFVNDIGTAILQAASASPDGRVRGQWDSLGAATGRMTCSAPNLLGIPHAPAVRSKIIAPRGYTIISIDASQMELRVAADVLQEEKLLELFKRERTDIHQATAALLLGKNERDVTTEERKRAKVVNFGLLFAMQEAGLQEYARENYGVILSEAEASRWRRDFLGQFDRIRSWQERVRREEATVVVTAAGRRRRFFDGGRDFNARLAHEIQGSAADAMKHALVEVAPILPAYDARLVLAPHDELVFEVPIAAAPEAAQAFRSKMESGFRRVLPRVRLAFDITSGPHWT